VNQLEKMTAAILGGRAAGQTPEGFDLFVDWVKCNSHIVLLGWSEEHCRDDRE
jgi:hypothetical protein